MGQHTVKTGIRIGNVLSIQNGEIPRPTRRWQRLAGFGHHAGREIAEVQAADAFLPKIARPAAQFEQALASLDAGLFKKPVEPALRVGAEALVKRGAR